MNIYKTCQAHDLRDRMQEQVLRQTDSGSRRMYERWIAEIDDQIAQAPPEKRDGAPIAA